MVKALGSIMWALAIGASVATAMNIVGCSSSSGASGGMAEGGCAAGGAGCSAGAGGVLADTGAPKDPDTAPKASIDRFSDSFGHLFKRSANSALPGANVPIDFDQGPFITYGLGPNGEHVAYYNFDVLPTTLASIYVFFPQGSSSELTSQLHIVDQIPGDTEYNDFWQVVMVTVPPSYVSNSVTSLAELTAAGFPLTPTNMIVNCPIVPDGSTAVLRYSPTEPNGLVRAWYRDQIVQYFSFNERMLTGHSEPVVPIYVTFNTNPDPTNPMSGPPSGFETEPGTMQTHNVISALPESSSYSPLWQVIAYDNAAFGTVDSVTTAAAAKVIVPNAGDVNCPVVAKTVADGG